MRLIFILVGLFSITSILNAQPAVSGRTIVPVLSTKKNTEFAPTISADGRTLIYESDVDKDKGWELFESKLNDNGSWSEPYPIKNINEKCNFLAGPSLSYDGNTLYFTAFIEDVTTSEDIYFSTRIDDKTWSEPKSISAPINTDEQYEGFPSISADGNAMYFIRMSEENGFDKKSNEPCFTLFVSQRQADGTWGVPEALPAPINLGCERDPKIMADNHTLIFSSIREGGKGKYDLYQTRKQTDGSWSDPVALDFINADDNDQSPCISASGDIVFFYSLKDLYSAPIPKEYRQMINVTVQGFVKAEKTQKPVSVEIKVKSITTGNEFTASNNENDGRYSIVLTAGQKYMVSYINKDYVTETFELDYEKQETYLELKKEILMKSEYILELSVIDPDTKEPVNAWINFSGPKVVFKDSVKGDKYPLQLTLEAAKNYKIVMAGPGYPELTEDWKFDASKILPKMTHTVNLLHEKVKYIASVTNISTNQKAKIKVYFKNETTGEVIVADAGEVVYLRKGDRYQIVTSSDKGFLFSSTAVVADNAQVDTSGNVVVGMNVAPLDEGAQLTLNNITFAFNSSDLKMSSFLELDQVIDLMKKNPGLSIEISAHTDDIGTDEANQKLSEKRALSVVRYLSQKGTAIERLRPIGFGKTKPVVPNDSEENRAMNRRVELRVLKVI